MYFLNLGVKGFALSLPNPGNEVRSCLGPLNVGPDQTKEERLFPVPTARPALKSPGRETLGPHVPGSTSRGRVFRAGVAAQEPA